MAGHRLERNPRQTDDSVMFLAQLGWDGSVYGERKVQKLPLKQSSTQPPKVLGLTLIHLILSSIFRNKYVLLEGVQFSCLMENNHHPEAVPATGAALADGAPLAGRPFGLRVPGILGPMLGPRTASWRVTLINWQD